MSTDLTARLFALLADGHLHSGTELARELGVTRSAVWKQIRQLEACGLRVMHEPRKGYRLPATMQALKAGWLHEQLRTRIPWASTEILWQCDSTNPRARALLQATNRPSVVFCECQQAGRGRRGRNWISAPGASLVLSLARKTRQPMQNLQALSLQLGLACVQVLWAHGFEQARLKWPNDLVMKQGRQWRKLGGMLVELSGEIDGPVTITAGLGLNLQLHGVALPPTALPLANLTDLGPLDRNRLAADLAQTLAEALSQAGKAEFSSLLEAYQQAHALQGCPVQVMQLDRCLNGTVEGVDDQGNLLLRQGRQCLTLSAGEISVRPDEDAAD